MSIKINIQNLSKSLNDKIRYLEVYPEDSPVLEFNKFGETINTVFGPIYFYGNKNKISFRSENDEIIELTPPKGKNFLNLENNDLVTERDFSDGVVQQTDDLKFKKNGENFELYGTGNNDGLLFYSYTADLF